VIALLLLACSGSPEPAPELIPGAPAPERPHEVEPDGQPVPREDHATVHHRFDDAEKWAEVFDDPARDAWQKPAALVAALDLPRGATVADIGAGTGYFNAHLAGAVGSEGRVVAVDIEPALVAHMKARALEEGTLQVEARLGEPADPGLGAEEVELVLLVDTYHHIDERRAYFAGLRRAVRPGGRLVVVDFKPGELPVGPPEHARVPQAQVVDELVAAGWHTGPSLDLLPYQFVQIMVRDPVVTGDLSSLQAAAWEALPTSANHCPDSFDYWPDGGLQNFWCHAQGSMSLEQVAGASGMGIWRSGPHTLGALDLDEPTAFGHYDPAFVDWLVGHGVRAAEDAAFRGATQDAYDGYARPLARTMWRARRKLQANRDCKARELKAYQAAMESGTPGYYERWYGFLAADWCTEQGYGGRVGNGNVVKSAVGFWLRRELDGTADAWARGLEKLLVAYDADWMENPGRP